MLGKKKTVMENILILGLGGVGAYLAKRLVHEGYAVTAIEPDSNLIRYTDNHLDARLIQGSAMSMDCWREARAENIDVLIAVTDNDAVNMLASMIADRFGILRKIARVRSTDLAAKDSVLSADDLKIDLIIHPEELAAQDSHLFRYNPSEFLGKALAALTRSLRTVLLLGGSLMLLIVTARHRRLRPICVAFAPAALPVPSQTTVQTNRL